MDRKIRVRVIDEIEPVHRQTIISGSSRKRKERRPIIVSVVGPVRVGVRFIVLEMNKQSLV
jgi:hypothetical protein